MKWETKYPIDYSSNGDSVDEFAQKTKAEFKLIYVLLNALRQNFPLKSEPSDTLPFQFWVDVSGGKIYMRNSKDDGWNVLGNIDEDYFVWWGMEDEKVFISHSIFFNEIGS